MPYPQRSSNNSRGAFVEPTNLGEFNSRLAYFGINARLSATEYRLLLENHQKADIVRALISLHNGGQHSSNASAYLSRILSEVKDAVGRGDAPNSDGKAFVEPSSIGELNALLTRHDLGSALNKPAFDLLIQTMGRSDLIDALRAVHLGTSNQAEQAEVIRHQVQTALVRAARGETASNPRRPEDDLPQDTGGDTGFHGVGVNPQRNFVRERPSNRTETAINQRSNQRTSQTDDQQTRGSAHTHKEPGQAFPERHQARAYGKRAALCVEAIDANKGPTLMIEMAPAIEKRDKEYDWKNGKMRFQLMNKELLDLIAVLYAFAPSVEFKNHGETKVKSLTLENQDGGKLYMKLSDKNQPMLVLPITEKDTLAAFTGLALAQALKAFPGFTNGDLIVFIRQRVAPHIPPIAARAASTGDGR